MPKPAPHRQSELQSVLGNRNLVLLGCGKMGRALLDGWLASGVPSSQLQILEPHPTAELQALVAEQQLELNPAAGPADPAVAIIAVKPQVLPTAVPALRSIVADGTMIVSIAAGTRIAQLQALLPGNRIVRAMPNTPAAIGHGITALVGDDSITEAERSLAASLLAAVGTTVWLTDEGDMDAVTAVSGSGPAYVFHLIETLAAAGAAEGLDPALALSLARATVAGAGALADQSDKAPAVLREEVTSPGGTTADGLTELMDPIRGLQPLIGRTVAAAARRSRELAKD